MTDQPPKHVVTRANKAHAPGASRPCLLFVEMVDPFTPEVAWRKEMERLGCRGCEFSWTANEPMAMSEQIDRFLAATHHAISIERAVSFRLWECDVRRASTELLDAFHRLSVGRVGFVNLEMPPLLPLDSPLPGFRRYQDAINFTHALMRECRFEAEAAGIRVGLVAGAGTCLLSPVELRELIDAIGSWTVGACVDATILCCGPTWWDWMMTLRQRVATIRVDLRDDQGASHLLIPSNPQWQPKRSSPHPLPRREREASLSTLRIDHLQDLLDEVHFEGAVVHRATLVERSQAK